jgi:hypothetical protein
MTKAETVMEKIALLERFPKIRKGLIGLGIGGTLVGGEHVFTTGAKIHNLKNTNEVMERLIHEYEMKKMMPNYNAMLEDDPMLEGVFRLWKEQEYKK